MRIRMTHLLCAGAGAIVFSILLERLSLGGVATGAAAGLLFAAAVRPIGKAAVLPLHGLSLLRYGALLLADMAASTARQMRAVLRPHLFQAAILHLRPAANEQGRVLVANSITLTPGTVTLEENETEYAVLCADPPAQPEARQDVAAHFEKRLPKKGVRS